MTDDLTALLHHHTHDDEPPFAVDPRVVIRAGHRVRRRRRVAATGGGAFVALAGAVGVAAVLVPDTGTGVANDRTTDSAAPTSSTPSPSTPVSSASSPSAAHPPAELLHDLRRGVAAALSSKIRSLPDPTIEAEGVALDGRPVDLDARNLDQARRLGLRFQVTPRRVLVVYLSNEPGATHQSTAHRCASSLSCGSRRLPGGDLLETTVTQVIPDGEDWDLVFNPAGFEPGDLWFQRTVIVIRDNTTVGVVVERVRATSGGENPGFLTSADDLVPLVDDPSLQLPNG